MNSNLTLPLSWHVVYTLPNYEKKVNSSLIKHEIATFLPLQKIERIWSDRRKILEVPLFPNYIFIQTSEKQRFKVLDIFAVKCYVSCNGPPVQVRNDEIDSIKRLLQHPSINLEQNLVKGDMVRICNGPFKDMNGILSEKMGQARFCVKIESINQVLSIDVCSSWLERVKK